MNILLTAVVAIFVFGALILIHEFGHFIAAKKFGVKVNEFAIGMGPTVWSTQKGETTYALRALPVGGFAWSQGLAAAVERGHADTAEGVRRWLWGVLRLGLVRNDLPLLLRMHTAASNADADALARWNALMRAGRESRELWQEEIQMGRALRRILHDQDMLPHWPLPDNAGYTACFAVAAVMLDQHARSMEPFSDPAAQQRAGVDTACAFVWSWLQNQVAVACKTVPLGQTAAQKLLLEFMPAVPQLVAQAAALPDEDIGSSLPGLARCCAGHERQYTRLFRS